MNSFKPHSEFLPVLDKDLPTENDGLNVSDLVKLQNLWKIFPCLVSNKVLCLSGLTIVRRFLPFSSLPILSSMAILSVKNVFYHPISIYTSS